MFYVVLCSSTHWHGHREPKRAQGLPTQTRAPGKKCSVSGKKFQLFRKNVCFSRLKNLTTFFLFLVIYHKIEKCTHFSCQIDKNFQIFSKFHLPRAPTTTPGPGQRTL